jgi:hypothetical protein
MCVLVPNYTYKGTMLRSVQVFVDVDLSPVDQSQDIGLCKRGIRKSHSAQALHCPQDSLRDLLELGAAQLGPETGV